MNSIQLPTLFLELAFQPVPEGWSEILIAELSEAGFDSFHEDEEALLAYIPETAFDKNVVHQLMQKYPELKEVSWSVNRMPEKNWNAIWESSYKPVMIAGRCYIRAPFHPAYSIRNSRFAIRETHYQVPDPGSLIEIIIEPKMSFGTAHHETTSLMIEALLEEELTGKSVLDMGCGTGILAILASRMGAHNVIAIDVDERAVENAKENFAKNNTMDGIVIQGDDAAIPEERFDVILANINRNTLIEQMPSYADALGTGGILFLSGFYSEDLPAIEECAAGLNLGRTDVRKKNNWIVAKFVR